MSLSQLTNEGESVSHGRLTEDRTTTKPHILFRDRENGDRAGDQLREMKLALLYTET